MRSSAKPVADEAAARLFLAGTRFAVIGASDNPKSFSAAIDRELSGRGFELVPVNPNSSIVWQRDCYHTVAEVPGVVDGAIVMVPAAAAADVVRQCIDAGIRNVWLFKGIGSPGSVSPEATDLCQQAGINVVDGACPLMFVEHAGWFHRLHHSVRVARGAVVDSAAVT